MPIATVNPATGETLETFDPLDQDAVELALAKAASAFRTYRATSFEERAELLRRAAGLLDAEREQIARTVTTEMGKPLAQARAEAAKSAKALRWYADHGAALIADEYPGDLDVADSGAELAYVRYRPLGAVLAVMPWNFPLWQVVRFLAPALMAGNVALLKHASNVPRTAVALADLFRRAGAAEGCFQSLLVGSDVVPQLIGDPRVAAVTLTGSEGAGRAVGAAAGEALKKSVLELGGSDPFLVLPSADLTAAVSTAVRARIQNNGQSCIAAKRFIVHEEVYPQFAAAFAEAMRALRVGDPMDPSTDLGPLATRQGRDDLAALVADALAHGAIAETGGTNAALPSAGWYYPPTVLTGVTPAMRVHREETFGPVAVLYRVQSLEQAVELANATPYGLSSNVWTTDPGERDYCLRELEAGGIFFNGMTASHPALPFGGVKHSGYGRELAGHGIREFCNVTTVWLGNP
ncbi:MULTISPECIES: NADP-dependent succinic semialdehyde dehydrogenase [unclassified Kitasatospora]|uniref:NADP-dependent succinic semialdehyde dehydrogenase n=1 Tax=unclassified Kitasatospora TaxID=2633591 RepID=UPI00070F5BAF|nr:MULTISPECIES: NADP-dependent succinic semialdehyde dehydrogenase [unclassified Kitasatospora]KQV21835.1 succinate-semialdehyde dehydrogenase [Kitasatospora sp. Root107]KRB75373.1 succinate-semialdehyde dehydrogenase [Kitasatospora sp. Root187]